MHACPYVAVLIVGNLESFDIFAAFLCTYVFPVHFISSVLLFFCHIFSKWCLLDNLRLFFSFLLYFFPPIFPILLLLKLHSFPFANCVFLFSQCIIFCFCIFFSLKLVALTFGIYNFWVLLILIVSNTVGTTC